MSCFSKNPEFHYSEIASWSLMEELYGSGKSRKAGTSHSQRAPGKSWFVSGGRKAGKGAAAREALGAYLARESTGVSPRSAAAQTFVWSRESELLKPKETGSMFEQYTSLVPLVAPEFESRLMEKIMAEAARSLELLPPAVKIEKEDPANYTSFAQASAMAAKWWPAPSSPRYVHYSMSAFWGVDPASDPLSYCDECGGTKYGGHVCPRPDAIDAAAVRTIQTLAAQGLSAEEIASDMGLRWGWRHWGVSVRGLTGSGAGYRAAWKIDRPQLATCAVGCSGRKRNQCRDGSKPGCSIHAGKDRERIKAETSGGDWRAGDQLVFGQVAMWGDVIECSDGWLVTRAYPLALPESWARMYRCAVLA